MTKQQQEEMKRESEQVVKVEVEEKQNLDELRLKYDGVLKELQDEINKLKESVDLLNGDLVRERQIVSDMRKILKEDIKKKTVKIMNDYDKNFNMLRKTVAEGYQEKDEAIEGLLVEKGLIEKKLVDSGKIIEELKIEKQQIAVEKDKIEKNRDDLLLKLARLEKHQAELDSERKKFKEISEEEISEEEISEEEDECRFKTSILALKKNVRVLYDASKHLESEVRSLKDNLKRVEAEKSEIQKQLKNALSELHDKSSIDLMEGVDADKGKELNLRKRKIGSS